MFESTINKIRIMFALNLAIMLAYLTMGNITIAQAMLIFFVFFLMNGVGVVMGFHRFYSHKSFEFKNRMLEILVLIFGTLSGSGSAVGWAGIHRAHHKFSDTDLDPHKAERGFWAMLSLNYNQDFSPRLIVDMYKNKLVMWFHNYYFVPIIMYVVGLYLAFGFTGVAVGFSIPALMTVAAEGATNYINHKTKDGYAASNVWWMNVFSFGDGWHKNHHDKPTAWTTREKWYQLDIIGILIKYMFSKHTSLKGQPV